MIKNTPKPILIYSLYCGGLYGTERMALATLSSLSNDFKKILLCPPGEADLLAKQRGISSDTFTNKFEFFLKVIKLLFHHNEIVVISSSVSHSIIFILLSYLLFKEIKHFHIVHGGADELNSYQKKRILRFFPVSFIAVSYFVKNKLIHYGINVNKISVVENFIVTNPRKLLNKHLQWPAKKIVLVSRLDEVKRLDLLITLLSKYPTLNRFSFTIFGTGADINNLQSHANSQQLNIHYAGYSPDIITELQNYDLFLHLCPDEPFGLVILEAMLAEIPILAPDQGGPAEIICNAKTGFSYRHADIDNLAKQLENIVLLPPAEIKSIVGRAHKRVISRYSTEAGAIRYTDLIKQ